MKLLKYLFFVLLVSLGAKAQNVLSENYQFNNLAISPAFTGERGNYGFSVLLGNQFNGTVIPNQVNQIFTVDGKIGDSNSSIGFQGFRNAYGNLSTTGFNLNYAYEIKTGTVDFKIGTDLGFVVLPLSNFDNSFLNRFSTFGGAGVLAKSDRWFGNVSSPTLIASEIGRLFIGGRKINLYSGYLIGDKEGIAFAPSVLLSLASDVNTSTQFHVNTKVWLFDRWVIGASVRNTFGNNKGIKIVPSLEYNLNGSSRFGLSYDSKPSYINSDAFLGNINPSVIEIYYRYDLELGNSRSLLNWF